VTNVITIESIDDPVFRNVADMENDLEAIKNWATTIMLLSGDSDLEDNFQGVLGEISREITRRVEAVFERRSKLWDLTHPNRKRVERESAKGQAGTAKQLAVLN